MELPYLKKNRKQLGGGAPLTITADPTQERTPMDDESGLMDQVCDELMQAIETKDKGMLMDALRALVLYIQDEDDSSDASEMPMKGMSK